MFFWISQTTSCHTILKKAVIFPSNEFGSKKLHLYFKFQKRSYFLQHSKIGLVASWILPTWNQEKQNQKTPAMFNQLTWNEGRMLCALSLAKTSFKELCKILPLVCLIEDSQVHSRHMAARISYSDDTARL